MFLDGDGRVGFRADGLPNRREHLSLVEQHALTGGHVRGRLLRRASINLALEPREFLFEDGGQLNVVAVLLFELAQLPLQAFDLFVQIPRARLRLVDQRRVDALADLELRGEFRVLPFALLEHCLECDREEKVYRVALDTSASSTGVHKLQRSMRLHLRNIVSFEQPAELLAGERHDRFLAASRPVKLLLPFDHLVPDHEAVAVPVQSLQLVTSLADEAEQRLAEGVLVDHRAHQRGQSVPLPAHVHRFPVQDRADQGTASVSPAYNPASGDGRLAHSISHPLTCNPQAADGGATGAGYPHGDERVRWHTLLGPRCPPMGALTASQSAAQVVHALNVQVVRSAILRQRQLECLRPSNMREQPLVALRWLPPSRVHRDLRSRHIAVSQSIVSSGQRGKTVVTRLGGYLNRAGDAPPRATCSKQDCSDESRPESVDSRSGARRFRRLISSGVNASAALACRVERLIIVNQKMRQLKMQNVASRLTSRSAVRSFDCSAWQPDYRILWNVSIFQRSAYLWSFFNRLRSRGD